MAGRVTRKATGKSISRRARLHWLQTNRKEMATQLLFIGTTELMLIAGIALLLFGGKKLPEMMRGMGRGISEFKKGAKEVTEPFEEVKKEFEESKKGIDEVIKE